MSRILILIYGLIAYLAFFAVILYAIGFAANFIVPKGIDHGTQVSLAETLIVNIGILLIFAIQHTIMARPAFKIWFTKIIPPAAERSTFVLIASIILAVLFWQWRPLPEIIWQAESQTFRILLWGLSACGWIIVFYSSFLIDHFDLFGLRQVYLNYKGVDYSHHPFSLKSLYRFVRHPLMLGFLIAFWSTPDMTQGHLLFNLVITIYIIFGVKIEERDLVKTHGKDYINYQKSTSMLIPFPKSNQS